MSASKAAALQPTSDDDSTSRETSGFCGLNDCNDNFYQVQSRLHFNSILAHMQLYMHTWTTLSCFSFDVLKVIICGTTLPGFIELYTQTPVSVRHACAAGIAVQHAI